MYLKRDESSIGAVYSVINLDPGMYNVPHPHPAPWVKFIKSVGEEYQVVERGRLYRRI